MQVKIISRGKQLGEVYPDAFNPSFLINKADGLVTVQDYGFMTGDVVMGYHWIRVYYTNGFIDIQADDFEPREA
jgi:hypothetical protein